MGRIVATLAVIALLFSVGSAWADDNSETERLFIEALKLVKSVEDLERGSEEKAVALEEALRKLNEIIDDHPSCWSSLWCCCSIPQRSSSEAG